MARQDQQFTTFQEWTAHAREWPYRVDRFGKIITATDEAPIFFDSIGRQCVTGRDFIQANTDKSFPVRWLWPDQIGGVALYSIGCRALKYQAEVLLVELRARDVGGPVAEALAKVSDTLDLMDKVGTPSAADRLHRKMLLSLLVDAAFDTLASFEEFFRDVETWKSSEGEQWRGLMLTKIAALGQKLHGLQAPQE